MKKLICVLLALMVLFAFTACGADTEPVRKPNENVDTTEGTQTEPKTEIFTITVLHGDGEESTSRMTSECDNLAAALLERNFITEDMLTVGGEKADPEKGAYWTLYVDGVYATESWDQIPLEGGVEYMFEYTLDASFEDPTEEDSEGPIEDLPDEEVTDEDISDEPVTE